MEEVDEEELQPEEGHVGIVNGILCQWNKLSDLTPTVSSGLLGDCDCLFGDFSGDFRINELTSNGRYFEPFVVWGVRWLSLKKAHPEKRIFFDDQNFTQASETIVAQSLLASSCYLTCVLGSISTLLATVFFTACHLSPSPATVRARSDTSRAGGRASDISLFPI